MENKKTDKKTKTSSDDTKMKDVSEKEKETKEDSSAATATTPIQCLQSVVKVIPSFDETVIQKICDTIREYKLHLIVVRGLFDVDEHGTNEFSKYMLISSQSPKNWSKVVKAFADEETMPISAEKWAVRKGSGEWSDEPQTWLNDSDVTAGFFNGKYDKTLEEHIAEFKKEGAIMSIYAYKDEHFGGSKEKHMVFLYRYDESSERRARSFLPEDENDDADDE